VNVSCDGEPAGDRPVIILLHGGGDGLDKLADLQKTLSDKDLVCSYDRLGAGASDNRAAGRRRTRATPRRGTRPATGGTRRAERTAGQRRRWPTRRTGGPACRRTACPGCGARARATRRGAPTRSGDTRARTGARAPGPAEVRSPGEAYRRPFGGRRALDRAPRAQVRMRLSVIRERSGRDEAKA
jgi:hypothetical protein